MTKNRFRFYIHKPSELVHYEWNGEEWTRYYSLCDTSRLGYEEPVQSTMNVLDIFQILNYFRLTEKDVLVNHVAKTSPRTLAMMYAKKLP